MVDWIIYYDDGSVFTNEDGPPEKAPRRGVLVISVRDDTCGRRLLFDQDTYCWQNNQWIPHDRFQCERYLDSVERPIRLCGYWVRNETFKAIMRQASDDPRLPLKYAKHPMEPVSIKKWLE